jgi:hypothetical protein
MDENLTIRMGNPSKILSPPIIDFHGIGFTRLPEGCSVSASEE